jgi:hypothetical protein
MQAHTSQAERRIKNAGRHAPDRETRKRSASKTVRGEGRVRITCSTHQRQRQYHANTALCPDWARRRGPQQQIAQPGVLASSNPLTHQLEEGQRSPPAAPHPTIHCTPTTPALCSTILPPAPSTLLLLLLCLTKIQAILPSNPLIAMDPPSHSSIRNAERASSTSTRTATSSSCPMPTNQIPPAAG